MTTKLPPCPVCGVVPEIDPCYTPESPVVCCRLHPAASVDLALWTNLCDAELGRALRTHDIETVAQVGALAKLSRRNAVDFDDPQANVNNSEVIAALQSRVTELEGETEKWKDNHARCMRKLASALESLEQCQAESNRHVDQIVAHSDMALAAIEGRDQALADLAKARGEVERVTSSYVEVARDLRSAVSDRNNLRSVVCEMLALTQLRGLDAPDDYMEVLRRLDVMAEYKISPQYINLVDNAAAPTEGQDNKV